MIELMNSHSNVKSKDLINRKYSMYKLNKLSIFIGSGFFVDVDNKLFPSLIRNLKVLHLTQRYVVNPSFDISNILICPSKIIDHLRELKIEELKISNIYIDSQNYVKIPTLKKLHFFNCYIEGQINHPTLTELIIESKYNFDIGLMKELTYLCINNILINNNVVTIDDRFPSLNTVELRRCSYYTISSKSVKNIRLHDCNNIFTHDKVESVTLVNTKFDTKINTTYGMIYKYIKYLGFATSL